MYNSTVITMSEFARGVEENAILGTYHGHGNCMCVMGVEVYWGVLIVYPSLTTEKLDDGDLAITTDFRDVFGDLPFIAEDLGLITPEVDELRERFGMPGMRILQFGFADRGGHLYLPHKFVPNTVVYTGTHDNNTTLGWWRDDATDVERANVQTFLGPIRTDADIVWAMMRCAAASVANLCIFPLQDVLGLGSDGRMNTPAAGDGDWTLRFSPHALDPNVAAGLADLMEMTDRDGYIAPSSISVIPAVSAN